MQLGLSRRLIVCLTAALLVGPLLSAGPSPTSAVAATVDRTTSASKGKLTLRMYNYARLDSASLAASEKVAEAIFENAGIQAVWVDCPLSEQEPSAYPACQSPMGTSDIVLRILPRHMAIKLRRHNDPLGFAQICSENEPACELNVFDHQIEELATHGYRTDLIRGYVIAHEVAHILLGPAHSDEGIMRAEWTRADLQHISWGLSLGFTGKQSAQLRNAALRRTISAPKDLLQANLLTH